MRILIVHNYYQDFGGEDVVFHQETEALSELPDYTVETLTFHNKKGFKGLFQFLLSIWNIFASRRLKRKIKEFNPDVVHIHNTQYACGPIIIRTAKKLGIPVVMSLHNFRLLCPSATLFYDGHIYTKSIQSSFPWDAVRKKVLDSSLLKTFWTAFSYWLHRRMNTWQMVDRYFLLSAFARDMFLSSTLQLDPKKIIIKPNFSEKQPESQEIKTFKEYYVYIGRLSLEKGILSLLEAVRHTDITLHIFGTGPLEEQVKKYAAQNDKLVLHGFKPMNEINKYLTQTQALIVPSICYEGMPVSVIESFAIGTPVLSSSLGVLKEMVIPSKTGLLFDPYDKNDIIRTIKTWESYSMDEKKQVSLYCIRSFHSKYSKDMTVHILMDTYKNVLQKKDKT